MFNDGVELNLHKMTTPQEKAQCVSWFIETKSDVQTQRNYRSKYGRDPPSRHSFVYGTRNLWRQGQCLIQGGVGDQEHLKSV